MASKKLNLPSCPFCGSAAEATGTTDKGCIACRRSIQRDCIDRDKAQAEPSGARGALSDHQIRAELSKAYVPPSAPANSMLERVFPGDLLKVVRAIESRILGQKGTPTEAQIEAAIEAYDRAWNPANRGLENKQDAIRAALVAAGQQGGGDAADADERKGGTLYEASMRAAINLPEGYSIEIELEQGYGCVRWSGPDGEWHDIEGEGWLCADLNDAIDAAIQAQAGEAPTGGAA